MTESMEEVGSLALIDEIKNFVDRHAREIPTEKEFTTRFFFDITDGKFGSMRAALDYLNKKAAEKKMSKRKIGNMWYWSIAEEQNNEE